jgi:hypothetical protein
LLALYNSPVGPAIWIDLVFASNTNTVPGDDGTPNNPVSSEAAALTLATALGIRAYWILFGNMSLANDYIGWLFAGPASGSPKILSNNHSFLGVGVRNLAIWETVTLNSGYDLQMWECLIGSSAVGLSGEMYNSIIHSTMTLTGPSDLFMSYCKPSTDSATITLDDSGGPIELRNMDWRGKLTIAGMTNAASKVFISADAAEITIAASCTAGSVDLSGDLQYIDNSQPGCTVTADGISSAVFTSFDVSGNFNYATELGGMINFCRKMAGSAQAIDPSVSPSQLRIYADGEDLGGTEEFAVDVLDADGNDVQNIPGQPYRRGRIV